MRPTRLLAAVVAPLALLVTAAVAGPMTAQASTTTASSFTYYGASVYDTGTKPWLSLVSDADSKYGHLDVVRVYYPGAPQPWPGPAGGVNRSVVVSFRILPKDVLSGRYDSQLTSWFKNAPRDRQIWWTYIHEPENDIAAGRFTASAYRAAFQHIAAIANRNQPSNMHSTLILMCYTLQSSSHRNFYDYYPGSSAVSTLAWDCYNKSKGSRYEAPSTLLDTALSFTHKLGKTFGVAEYGSAVISGDAAGRASWVKAVGLYAHANGAAFTCYFNSPRGPGGDYRLLDSPSITSMRSLVTSN